MVWTTMIPIVFLGIVIGVIVIASFKDSHARVQPSTPIQVRGELNPPADLTPHLTEFTNLIRSGHRPSQWLITEAISEAWEIGNWKLAQTISHSYPSEITSQRRNRKEVEKEAPKVEKEIEEKVPKQLSFSPENTTSPVRGIPDDDWRMFVHASTYEAPEFDSGSSIGMFRQNKKRIGKLGIPIEKVKDPVEQYNAFELEVVGLLDEGKEIIKQSVAMPIEVDGENVPMTLSGLLAVMRLAGTANAAKWIDSQDERKKFPNTTEAFKRANGCF